VIGAELRNNRFYHFNGVNSDGIDIGEQSIDIFIEGNRIYSCKDKGISVGQQSTVEIYRNLIVDCGYGIAVKDSNSTAIVDQNTLFGNDIQLAAFEKNPGEGGGTIQAVNVILANTRQESLDTDEYSSLIVEYSLSDTEVLPGAGNLQADPEFVNPSVYNFRLMNSSPALDSGFPGSPGDPDGSPADMGAYYEFQSDDYPYPVPARIIINEIMYNADPDQDSGDWVEIVNASEESVNLRNWSLKDGDPNHDFGFDLEIILEPQEYVVLSSDITAFQEIYPTVDHYPLEVEFGFSSVWELLRLLDDSGRIRSTVYFLPDTPWPAEADGTGPSLELLHPTLVESHAQSWSASTGTGSPGEQNTQYTEPCEATGDLNQDGSMDVLDVVQLVAIVLQMDDPTEQQLCLADLNQDGSLDVLDIVNMIECILFGC